MVSLRYFAPAPDVRDLASVYYLAEFDTAGYRDTERAAIAQLRFILEGAADVTFVTGETFHGRDAVLVGPSTGTMQFTVTAPMRMFGIGIMPAGWAAFTRRSASDFADKAVPARDVFSPEVDKNLTVLRDFTAPEDMVAWADKVLRDLKPRVSAEILALTRLVDDWLGSAPSPPVAQLTECAPLSSRQLLRQVNRLYGMPPKYLARKYRALRAARAMAEHDEAELLELEDAFYDQSHMIREIKYFAGVTPTRLRVQEGEVARLIDQRAQLKGVITPIVSDT